MLAIWILHSSEEETEICVSRILRNLLPAKQGRAVTFCSEL